MANDLEEVLIDIATVFAGLEVNENDTVPPSTECNITTARLCGIMLVEKAVKLMKGA